MAFLQRLINGGGSNHREYALDRKRVDLLIGWKGQRIVVEIKVNRGENALERGLVQTAEYMDIANATEGHLIIFDGNTAKTWEEKIYTKEKFIEGKHITVWGM